MYTSKILRISPLFSYRTLFHFMEEDLSLIIKTLDPAKAHGIESLTVPLKSYLSSL